MHKTANVLNKLPESLLAKAKAGLHEIWMAATRKDPERAFDLSMATYEAKYPKATACLEKDREPLLAFCDCPAEHWTHQRTTNPIEATFATVWLRTAKTYGAGSRLACLTMVFQFSLSAQKRWRRLNGHALLAKVIQGAQFQDGIRSTAA